MRTLIEAIKKRGSRVIGFFRSKDEDHIEVLVDGDVIGEIDPDEIAVFMSKHMGSKLYAEQARSLEQVLNNILRRATTFEITFDPETGKYYW